MPFPSALGAVVRARARSAPPLRQWIAAAAHWLRATVCARSAHHGGWACTLRPLQNRRFCRPASWAARSSLSLPSCVPSSPKKGWLNAATAPLSSITNNSSLVHEPLSRKPVWLSGGRGIRSAKWNGWSYPSQLDGGIFTSLYH